MEKIKTGLIIMITALTTDIGLFSIEGIIITFQKYGFFVKSNTVQIIDAAIRTSIDGITFGALGITVITLLTIHFIAQNGTDQTSLEAEHSYPKNQHTKRT